MKRGRNSCCADSCIDLGYFVKTESFHGVPKDAEARKKWVEILRIPERLITHPQHSKNLKVCGNHFTADDYRMVGHRRLLKTEAIPSQNLEKGMVVSWAPDKVARKRKGLDTDDKAPAEKDPAEKDPADEPINIVSNENEEGVRSRPKRRAAEAAAKKMVEATSTELDDILRDQEEEAEVPISVSSSATDVEHLEGIDGTSFTTADGRVVYLKDMVIVNPSESVSRRKYDSSHSTISITPIGKVPQKARKSFPSRGPPLSQGLIPSNDNSPIASKHSRDMSRYVSADHVDPSLDLDMQCEEEALSPCQVTAHNKAVLDYQHAMNKIRKLSSENCVIQYDNDDQSETEYVVNSKHGASVSGLSML